MNVEPMPRLLCEITIDSIMAAPKKIPLEFWLKQRLREYGFEFEGDDTARSAGCEFNTVGELITWRDPETLSIYFAQNLNIQNAKNQQQENKK